MTTQKPKIKIILKKITDEIKNTSEYASNFKEPQIDEIMQLLDAFILYNRQILNLKEKYKLFWIKYWHMM